MKLVRPFTGRIQPRTNNFIVQAEEKKEDTL